MCIYLVAQISPLEWKKASVCNHYDENDEHVEEDGDDEINDNEFHHHSSNSLNCEEDDFMTNRETSITTMRIEENTMELLEGENEKRNLNDDKEKEVEIEESEEIAAKAEGNGNCCENYNTSTLQQHQQFFKNMCVMNEQNDLESIWINMESRRNFLIERQRRQQHYCRQHKREQIGSSKRSAENLDIDDDGLIGYSDVTFKQAHDGDGSEEIMGGEYEEDGQEFTSFDDESQSIELISYVNNFSLKNSFAWTLGTLLQSTSDLYPKVFHYKYI